ncbi:MAG: hypothetical protein EBS42_12390, partial [Caulobacteraceae bacterium]|nr:hypothetical protein [Caulobacteraceae bacterium]
MVLVKTVLAVIYGLLLAAAALVLNVVAAENLALAAMGAVLAFGILQAAAALSHGISRQPPPAATGQGTEPFAEMVLGPRIDEHDLP